jgi:hypothetical protein
MPEFIHQTAASELDPLSGAEPAGPRSLALKKLAILYLSTGGLYGVYWYARSMRVTSLFPGHRFSVGVNTMLFAGYPASIVAFQAVYRLIVLPAENPSWKMAEATAGIAISALLLLAGAVGLRRLVYHTDQLREAAGGALLFRRPWLLVAEFSVLWLCWNLPNPYRYVSLISVVPIRHIQFAINQYLDVLTHRGGEEKHLTPGEIAVALLGAAVMLWLIGGALLHVMDVLSPEPGPD